MVEMAPVAAVFSADAVDDAARWNDILVALRKAFVHRYWDSTTGVPQLCHPLLVRFSNAMYNFYQLE